MRFLSPKELCQPMRLRAGADGESYFSIPRGESRTEAVGEIQQHFVMDASEAVPPVLLH